MAELSVTTIELPTAQLGPCSPLPMLEAVVPLDRIAGDVPAGVVSRARTGSPPTLFPYAAQDDYDREPALRQVPVAVLENETLRATVGLDVGGRLLSLYDHASGRELFYVNPVLQPANLALRNAWFSGGVEWNIGTQGHSPTTMDTVHAARVDGPDGEPVVRLWEWERLRGVVFQVDLWLPDGAAALLATIRIRNVNDTPTPMYWWTNAAIAVGPETRVVAPADRAFRTEYPNGLRVATVPDDGDGDNTYPAGQSRAADYFYDITPGRRPWIAAIDGDGSGTFQVSTGELRGRKLFVWGTGPGGERWQRWLSHDREQRYCEIQAGLAPTQFEHVMMPTRSELSWTEAFGSIEVDSGRSHGDDWATAVAHVEAAVEGAVPERRLVDWHRASSAIADRAPREILAVGSGWGALEQARCRTIGATWCDDTGTPFPGAALGPEQEPWVALLRTGELPWASPDESPASCVAGGDWDTRLAAATPNWLTEYHRAVIAHGRGDRHRATPHYEASLKHKANAWAMHGLAEVARTDGRRSDAATFAVRAMQAAPLQWRLAAAALSRLLDDERPDEALALVDELPAEVRSRGRIRLLEAWAAVGAGNVERARASLESGLEIPDLREGERSLDAVWTAAFPDRDVPAEYDFRMT